MPAAQPPRIRLLLVEDNELDAELIVDEIARRPNDFTKIRHRDPLLAEAVDHPKFDQISKAQVQTVVE